MSRAPRCLGVLGGMGPLAGAHFAVRVAELTPVTRDQDHIPLLLRNDPRIPDPSTAWMNGDASQLPAMMHRLALQHRPSLVRPTAGRDERAALAYRAGRRAGSAAAGRPCRQRRRAGHTRHAEDGFVSALSRRTRLRNHRSHDVLADCDSAIAAVKGNRQGEAFAPLARAIAALQRDGARAVVLGCTELPLALPASRRGEFGVVITDSIDALAREAVHQFHPGSEPN